MRRFALLLLSLVSVPATLAHAQVQQRELVRGARVRVSAPALSARALIGRYDTLSAESISFISVHPDTLMRIPLSQITRLELSEGPNRGRGAGRGALVGFGASVVGGLLCQMACSTGNDANFAVVGGLFLGVFVGLPVGALLGGTMLAPERWRPISIPGGA